MHNTFPDMSDYVVHFTKPSEGQSAYENIMSILYGCRIEARNPFGLGRKIAPDESSQSTVCLSEVPLHRLSRLAKRRGDYGLGFRKSFLVELGGGPVLYAYKDTPHHLAVQMLMNRALGSKNASLDPVWKLTPFVEGPGVYSTGNYFFEWEREWRHVGHLTFQPDEVAILIMPEEQHKRARAFFEDAYWENYGPGFFCPYIDASWSKEKVEAALHKGTTTPRLPKRIPAWAQ